MKVSEIGEFGLIARLSKMSKITGSEEKEAWRRLVIGIGDDTAAYLGDSGIQLATIDTMVQDVHFRLSYTRWEELGWKALASNLSDIAAMGGIPRYALVSLGIPPDTEVEDVISLYQGMIDLAIRSEVAIVGGDTVSSPVVFVTVTVFGGAKDEKHLLKRSEAKPGDKIAVTNYLGVSAAGLEMLTRNLDFKPEFASQFKQAHLKPVPRINESRVLVKKGVKCGMDVSDGLIGDLKHICDESKVNAVVNVDSVPVSSAAVACFGRRALELALTGGEDYELLFTAGQETVDKVIKEIGCPVTVVGEITENREGAVTLVDSIGRPYLFKNKGWDHFS